MRRCFMFSYKGMYFFQRTKRKSKRHAFRIIIGLLEPKLVELVGRSSFGIEPYITTLTLAKFAAIAFCDKRCCHREGLSTRFAANEFCAGNYIPPLVGTAHLEFYVVGIVKMIKIKTLYQL